MLKVRKDYLVFVNAYLAQSHNVLGGGTGICRALASYPGGTRCAPSTGGAPTTSWTRTGCPSTWSCCSSACSTNRPLCFAGATTPAAAMRVSFCTWGTSAPTRSTWTACAQPSKASSGSVVFATYFLHCEMMRKADPYRIGRGQRRIPEHQERQLRQPTGRLLGAAEADRCGVRYAGGALAAWSTQRGCLPATRSNPCRAPLSRRSKISWVRSGGSAKRRQLRLQHGPAVARSVWIQDALTLLCCAASRSLHNAPTRSLA